MNERFKIVAIEPLKNCYQKHIKVLSRNTKYYLYNDYEIDENDNISYTPTISDDLYSSDGETLKINISAIVGKNGSGKSTLIELLLMAINNLSFALSIHNKEIETVALEPVSGLNVAVYFVSNKNYKLTINRNHISIKDTEKGKDKPVVLNLLYDNKDSKNTKDINIKPNGSYIDSDFNLKNFFYTIGTNYSQYALNSNDYGGWIENIFHKNDSYQTPLVVNPYRDKGNIDINKETDLIKSRLLAYLLLGEPEHLQLTEKQIALNAVFKLNINKYKNAYIVEVYSPKYKRTEVSFEQFFKKNNREYILDEIYSVFKIINVTTYYKEQLELYIIRKLISIARTYQKYFNYFNNSEGEFYYDKENEHNFRNYLKEISRIDSHVTYKLHQAINNLKNNPFDNLGFKTDKSFSIPFNKLSKEILKRCSKKNIINNIPSPIFDFDIEFEKNTDDKTEGNEAPTFNSLSSGEKQNIYTLYSVLYHINNINSVDDALHKYHNINLIFEEIELYFHPEMQRVWISYLLSQIKKQDFKNIKNINICFITHSPFILSDIPNQNILFLQVDKETKTSKPIESKTLTFGANIHDILSDSFFLEDGTIGKFASEKMKEIVAFHKEVMDQDVNEEIKKKFELKREYFNELINNIGEDVIKGILKNHIDNISIKLYGIKEYNANRIEELKEEIKRLEEQYYE